MRCSCFSFLKRRLRSRAIERKSIGKRNSGRDGACPVSSAVGDAACYRSRSKPRLYESVCRGRTNHEPLTTSLPNPASILPHHGLSHLASPSLLKFRHILHHAIHAIPPRRVWISIDQHAREFRSAFLAPHPPESQEEPLLRRIAVDLFGRLAGFVRRDHFAQRHQGNARSAIVGGVFA